MANDSRIRKFRTNKIAVKEGLFLLPVLMVDCECNIYCNRWVPNFNMVVHLGVQRVKVGHGKIPQLMRQML